MKKIKTYYYLETIEDFKSLIDEYVVAPCEDICFKVTEQGLVSNYPVSELSWEELEKILIKDPWYKFYYEGIHEKGS